MNLKNIINDILTNNELVIIDVRTIDEYNGRHIKNSINLPLNTLENNILKYVTRKDQKLFVYCQSGGSSTM